MAKLEILHYPDPRLRNCARPVDVVDEDVKMAVLTEMCPDYLQEHIRLNTFRLDTYEAMRHQIFFYILAKGDSKPMPKDMEIGFFGKSNKSQESSTGYPNGPYKGGFNGKDRPKGFKGAKGFT